MTMSNDIGNMMTGLVSQKFTAGLTPTTPITSTAISPVKMLIGRKSLTNLHSEMIFLQGKPIFLYLPTIYQGSTLMLARD
jgi:hypothetical protein